MLKFFKKKEKEPENFKEILAYFKNLEKNFENLSEELESFLKFIFKSSNWVKISLRFSGSFSLFLKKLNIEINRRFIED